MSELKKPSNFYGSVHQWRVNKRQELKRLEAAMQAFYFGSAFTPVSVESDVVMRQIKEMRRQCSVKAWGR